MFSTSPLYVIRTVEFSDHIICGIALNEVNRQSQGRVFDCRRQTLIIFTFV